MHLQTHVRGCHPKKNESLGESSERASQSESIEEMVREEGKRTDRQESRMNPVVLSDISIQVVGLIVINLIMQFRIHVDL